VLASLSIATDLGIGPPMEFALSACNLGVTPDYIIQVREDILEEEDGPVLQHDLKGLHVQN